MFVFLLCTRVGADITILREQEVDYDSDVPRKIAEVLIRKVPDDQQVSAANLGDCCSFTVHLFIFYDHPSFILLCVFPAVLGLASGCTG